MRYPWLALALAFGPSCGDSGPTRKEQEALLQRLDAMSQRLEALEKEVAAREAALAAAQEDRAEPDTVSLAHPIPATEVPSRPTSIQITLQVGRLLVDGEVMTRERAAARFREAAREAPDTRVSVLAEPEVPYQEMIEVLDLAREAGLEQIAISARVHGESEEAPPP